MYEEGSDRTVWMHRSVLSFVVCDKRYLTHVATQWLLFNSASDSIYDMQISLNGYLERDSLM